MPLGEPTRKPPGPIQLPVPAPSPPRAPGPPRPKGTRGSTPGFVVELFPDAAEASAAEPARCPAAPLPKAASATPQAPAATAPASRPPAAARRVHVLTTIRFMSTVSLLKLGFRSRSDVNRLVRGRSPVPGKATDGLTGPRPTAELMRAPPADTLAA